MTVACPGRQQLRLLIVAGLVGLLFVGLTAVASAQSDDNATCLGCHSTAGLSVGRDSSSSSRFSMKSSAWATISGTSSKRA